jgi:hypothetical protein
VAMFLRATVRKKDGKEHTYHSVVENKRLGLASTVWLSLAVSASGYSAPESYRMTPARP